MRLLFGFQDPVTPVLQGIINLHDSIFIWLFLILGIVIWLLEASLINFYWEPLYNLDIRLTLLFGQKIVHGTFLEIFWTVSPSIILMAIAIPSFTLLYSLEEVYHTDLTWIAIGSQWYWSYETAISYRLLK